MRVSFSETPGQPDAAAGHEQRGGDDERRARRVARHDDHAPGERSSTGPSTAAEIVAGVDVDRDAECRQQALGVVARQARAR